MRPIKGKLLQTPGGGSGKAGCGPAGSSCTSLDFEEGTVSSVQRDRLLLGLEALALSDSLIP